eukprot:768104-Hanusia_phi.AAC.2
MERVGGRVGAGDGVMLSMRGVHGGMVLPKVRPKDMSGERRRRRSGSGEQRGAMNTPGTAAVVSCRMGSWAVEYRWRRRINRYTMFSGITSN